MTSARGVSHPVPWAVALATVAMLAASPAFGAHCPPGEFYRVRLNQCVPVESRLALAYLHPQRGPAGQPRATGSLVGSPVDVPAPPFVMPALEATWPNEKGPLDEGLLRLGLLRAKLSAQ